MPKDVPPTMPTILVFDWDGTLIDSIGHIVATLQKAVAEVGLDALDDQAIRDTIGLGLADIMDRLFPEVDGTVRQRIVESYRSHWLSTFADRSALFPGVRAMLEELAAEDFLLAVATGKGRRGLRRDLERLDLESAFHVTRTADECFPKPHPQMLHEILDELGGLPHHALMIGDTTHDLEMAAHVRMPAIGVTTGSHGQERLEEMSPLACLSRVTELPGWLEEWAAEGSTDDRGAER